MPTPFDGMIWRVAKQASVALRLATMSPVTRGNQLPTIGQDGDVSVAWTNEAAALTQSEPTLKETRTDVKKLAAYSIMSNELLEDEEFQPGLIDFLVQIFGEAMGAEIDNQAFNGTGSPFNGVLSAPSGINTVTMSAGDGNFADVNFAYLSQMIAELTASLTPGAKFFMHRTIVDVLRRVRETTGQHIWTPPANGTPGTIWGFPYESVDKMPALSATATNTAFMIFGNFKNVKIGTKGRNDSKST